MDSQIEIMRTGNLLITAGTLLISLALNAQKKVYIGTEYGITNDQSVNISSNSQQVVSNKFCYGLTIGKEINDRILLETGMIRKDWALVFTTKFGRNENISFGTAFKTLQIPARFKSKINLYNQKIFFTAALGLNYVRVLGDLDDFGSKSTEYYYGQDLHKEVFTSFVDHSNQYFLIETSGGFEFKLFNKIIAAAHGTFFTGARKNLQITTIHILSGTAHGIPYEYYLKEIAAQSGGDYWNIGISLKYPIGSFWIKK